MDEMFQADALLASGEDALLAPVPAQPASARQASPLEESWVHTLNVGMDESAASTHTTCSPDGSDAVVQGEAQQDAGLLTPKREDSPGELSCAGTPPAEDHAGQKRKADVDFPPVGAPRTSVAGGFAPAGGCVTASGVALPDPEVAAHHRFTDEELKRLDMETSRANDIVAVLMARIDVFAMPQSGTGVSVEAVDPVFQAKMLDMLKQ